ncbi:Integrator complex subunit 3 [Cichlidogyrus casuarinus]|uniref:Integrator complex subunit 3 n=1 Tax=Cichlidogyrus casuarinus TaxID=1844966 RepID=A0ABD2Q1B6_9PLAT
MARFVAETWHKMSFKVKENLLQLLNDFLKQNVTNLEVLNLHLMRRVITGNLSYENVWLSQELLNIYEEHKEWVEGANRQPFLLLLVVITLLRTIPDHYRGGTIKHPDGTSPAINLTSLYNKECHLLISLMQRNFDRCSEIGRDFIRMLLPLSQYPEFQEFFTDLKTNISALTTKLSSFTEILYIETPKVLLQTIIPHEMEFWIRWMMKNVYCAPGVPVRKYQEMFNVCFPSHSLQCLFTRKNSSRAKRTTH